jgi:hypothetical protein
VFVARTHGECEPITGLLAWLLLLRGNIGSNNRYFHDRERRASLVYLLLYDGLTKTNYFQSR